MFKIISSNISFYKNKHVEKRNKILKRGLWDKAAKTSSLEMENTIEENFDTFPFHSAVQPVDESREGDRQTGNWPLEHTEPLADVW